MSYPDIIEGHVVESCLCERCAGLRSGKVIYPQPAPDRVYKSHDDMRLADWQKAYTNFITPKYDI